MSKPHMCGPAAGCDVMHPGRGSAVGGAPSRAGLGCGWGSDMGGAQS